MRDRAILSGMFVAAVVMHGIAYAAPPACTDSPPLTATFSIVAVDPESGICGAAVASKYPAVGKVVPYVRAGIGGFCTQLYVDASDDAVVELARKYAELDHDAKGEWRGGRRPFEHPCEDQPGKRASTSEIRE